MGDHDEDIRACLLQSFPVWARAAADESGVSLGEVIRFSEHLFFFPDCTVSVGGDIYTGNEQLVDIPVPLFIDVETVIDDLLAHPPGSFSTYVSGKVHFVSRWEVASPKQARDRLWYALRGWFETFNYRAEFEVGMRTRQLEDCTDSFWFSCYFAAFSERVELRFRSES